MIIKEYWFLRGGHMFRSGLTVVLDLCLCSQLLAAQGWAGVFNLEGRGHCFKVSVGWKNWQKRTVRSQFIYTEFDLWSYI
jgi:hypothetical protein